MPKYTVYKKVPEDPTDFAAYVKNYHHLIVKTLSDGGLGAPPCPANLLDDLIQECWQRIWQNRKRYKSKKGAMTTWIVTLCRRHWHHYWITNIARRLSPISLEDLRTIDNDQLGQPLDYITSTHIAPDTTIDILEMINKLPANHRRLIELKAIGYSCSEIAKMDGHSRQYVSCLLGKIITKLHKDLKYPPNTAKSLIRSDHLCCCNCGDTTFIDNRTGKPRPYLKGHNNRKRSSSVTSGIIRM